MFKSQVILFVVLLLFTTGAKAQFSQCDDHGSLDEFQSSLCATVKAPLTYQTDSKETINLFVRKFPSIKERQGSIWLIPGGPGESGASLYPLVSQFSKLFPHLDIFIPDHRGTGLSSKICPEEEAIDSPDGIALANDEWGPCFNQMYSNQNYVKSFSITNAAKDLNLLINDLSGEGKRYIYGVSYGTQLVLRLLQLNSTKIAGIILDSLVPLQDDNDYDLSHRSYITNNVGRSLLTHFDKLESNNSVSLATQMRSIIQRSKTDTAFAANLPKQDLSIIFGMMLDLPKVRNKIPEIIKALSTENFTPLNEAITEITEFYTSYGAKYNTSPSSIPLTQVITSSENNLRPAMKKSEVITESENLLFTSPLPYLIAENSMPTYQRDEYFAKKPTKMPPTLIVHGTLDPKTHITGALRNFKELSKNNKVSFVSVKDAPHFIALFAPDSFASVVLEFMKGQPLKNKTIRDESTLLR